MNKYSNLFGAQSKNLENMHLKADISGGKIEQNRRKRFLWIYFDIKAKIWIYSNINNVIIQIRLFIWEQKYWNIPIFLLISGMS